VCVCVCVCVGVHVEICVCPECGLNPSSDFETSKNVYDRCVCVLFVCV